MFRLKIDFDIFLNPAISHRYYPTVEATDLKDFRNDTTTRYSRLFTDSTTASILDTDNFLGNTTLVQIVFTTEPVEPTTVSSISEGELSSALTSTSFIIPKGSTTQSLQQSTTISTIANATETTVTVDLENSTLNTKYDQVPIATEQSSTSVECNENSCVTGTNMPSPRNISEVSVERLSLSYIDYIYLFYGLLVQLHATRGRM